MMQRHWQRLLRRLCVLLLVLGAAAQAAAPPPPDSRGSFRVLCWHDIRDHLRDSQEAQPDRDAVDAADLAEQFAWLREHGYMPVSLAQILAARAGGDPLPAKAVLLTFDDGRHSAYTHVFPLLRQFHYPAVIGLVTSWLEVPADGVVLYGSEPLPRSAFLSWQEAREMQDSGLVEIASHTHELHRGIPANPQGGNAPAAVTRAWFGAGAGYETEEDYQARVRADLQRSIVLIRQHLGRAPRALIWPYGEYNQSGVALAAELGMPVTLNLELGPNPPAQPLGEVRRTLMQYDSGVGDLKRALERAGEFRIEDREPERVVHVDLDYVYDPDPVQQERNLDVLVARMAELHPTSVYLQAFADPDGSGAVRALYFPNRHLPVRADLFARTAWQLRTRAHVKVYAWMPVLAFEPQAGDPVSAHRILASGGASAAVDESAYPRLTPFDPAVRRWIRDLYQDLARNARFAGLLFHDDATLSETEDFSPEAQQWYAREWGLAGDPAVWRADPAKSAAWAARKTVFLDAFTQELASTVRAEQPTLLTARNLYAPSLLAADGEQRFAQSYGRALQQYDYVALMAMPYLEGVSNPADWLDRVLAQVRRQPQGLLRTVFELQAHDWRSRRDLPPAELVSHLRRLKRNGARGLAYYPDDFLHDQPPLELIAPVLSPDTLYRPRVVGKPELRSGVRPDGRP